MTQPTSNFVNSMLTDLYQLTMCYVYWKDKRHEETAVFDLFFRKHPFDVEFSVFAGLDEFLKYVESFKFSDEDIHYLQHGPMKGCDPEFFEWLKTIDCSKVKIHAIAEGTIVFPRVPLARVEGPLAICQLLETAALNLMNYPTLIATNAARLRLAAGFDKLMLEFGLRRAQGPDGAMTASRYSVMGGFDGTSNVLAGKLFNLLVKGTHAHSFVQSYTGFSDLKSAMIKDSEGNDFGFVECVKYHRKRLGFMNTNDSELAAFIAYAQCFPDGFLALVDTYNTLQSGVPNFICVACALEDAGYKPVGIRLDSGDLAHFSKEARRMFIENQRDGSELGQAKIAASNDINGKSLKELNAAGHEIDLFGVGTNLVTCQEQPALGGVYKLVEINGVPTIKLSDDHIKITIPGRKFAYRLVDSAGFEVDLMILEGGDVPNVGEEIVCRDLFGTRMGLTPTKVIPLHECVWNGKLNFVDTLTIGDKRDYVLSQLKELRQGLPHPVWVSQELFDKTQELIEKQAVAEKETVVE